MKRYFLGLICLIFLPFFAMAVEKPAIEVSGTEELSFSLTDLKDRPVTKEIVIQNNTSQVKELFMVAEKQEIISVLLDNIIIEVQKKNNNQIILKTYLNELFQTQENSNIPIIATVPPNDKISLWLTASVDLSAEALVKAGPQKEISENEIVKFNLIFGFLGNILNEAAMITPEGERISNSSLTSLGNETAVLAAEIIPGKEKSFLAKNFNPKNSNSSLYAEADRYFALFNIYFLLLTAAIILILILAYIKSKKRSLVLEKIKENKL